MRHRANGEQQDYRKERFANLHATIRHQFTREWLDPSQHNGPPRLVAEWRLLMSGGGQDGQTRSGYLSAEPGEEDQVNR
jgi:hypothetical protein